MPELRSYSKTDLPRDLAIQVASYVRVQWPFVLGHHPPLWETSPYPADGRHFVLFDGDILIAHALAHLKRIEHVGEIWNVGALSSVFTYPTHRGMGHGERIVAAATESFRNGKFDFALLFCGERVRSLYFRTGWEHQPKLQVVSGDRQSPKLFQDGYILSMTLSARAFAAREMLEGTPIYVGTNTW